jgi:hypothetical protein
VGREDDGERRQVARRTKRQRSQRGVCRNGGKASRMGMGESGERHGAERSVGGSAGERRGPERQRQETGESSQALRQIS